MSLAVLVEFTPWDPVLGAAATVRACSHDDAALTSLNGVAWWPAIARLPSLSLRLFDGNFSGMIQPGVGEMELSIEPFPLAARYAWADRPAKIWVGDLGAAWGSFTLLFDGLVRTARIAAGRIGLSLRVNDDWMDGPLLTSFYAGTGGAEGGADLKGVAKPLAIGAPRYVEGRLIDAVNTVVQVHGYGAVNAIPTALDRLSRFPAPISDHADYAALVAATIAPGKVATAKAAGLIRHGAPPAGTLSYLVEGDSGGGAGWVRKPGAVIKRLAEIAGAIAGQIDAASMSALDTAVPRNLSRWFGEQTTPREAIGAIAASANASAGVNFLGKLFACRVAIGGSAALVLKTDGTALPAVGDPAQLEVSPPWWRMQMKGSRTERVHGFEEIAFTAQLNDRGSYNAITTYREGDIVFQPTNGATYLYTSTMPTAGNAPPNVTYWQQIQGQDPAIAAADAAAAAAQAAADAAQADANTANAVLAEIASDSLLTPVEKPTVIKDRDAIVAEQSGIDAQATALGITTEKTAYDNAVSALTAYLATLASPVAWDNLAGNTTIVGATFRTKFLDVYAARQTLLNKIAEVAATKAAWSGVTGTGKPEDNATRNAPGQALRNTNFDPAEWYLGSAGTTTRLTGAATGLPADYAIRIHAGVAASAIAPQIGTTTPKTPVQSGQTVWAGVYIYSSLATATLYLRIYWYGADGTYLGSFAERTFAPGAAQGYYTLAGVAPAAAAYALWEVDWTIGTTGYWFISSPYLGFSAPGADVTAAAYADLLAAAANYAAGTTYSKGQHAYDQNAIWVYVNATPGSGNAPPTLPTLSNSYWEFVGSNGLFTWIAYADSADGATNFTTGDAGTRKYIGIAPNKTTSTESTNPADYTWKLFVGADGAPGAPGLTVSVSPSSHTVSVDAAGTPKSGQLPKTNQIKLISGTTDVTESATYAIVGTPTNCTASVSNTAGTRGLVSISAMSADSASVEVDCTYGGATVRVKIALGKAYDGAPGSSARSAGGLANVATWTDTGVIVNLTVGPNGTIQGSNWLTYEVTSAYHQVGLRILYREINTSTWFTLCSDETGGNAINDAGYAAVSGSVAGPASSKVYEFKLQTYRNPTGTIGALNARDYLVSWAP